jgi:hypothetical protein
MNLEHKWVNEQNEKQIDELNKAGIAVMEK